MMTFYIAQCQADLPDTLRFGRVEVSCEGWNGPGDPMVLKGSCALEYRLVRIPKGLQNDDSYISGNLMRAPDDPLKTLFIVLWTLLLLFMLYHFFKSCFTRPRNPAPTHTTPRPRPSGGWFPGHNPDDTDSPPPYSRHGKPEPQSARWTPGFWTGLGLGGLASVMWGRSRDPEQRRAPRPSIWDWERANSWWGSPASKQAAPPATPSGGWFRGTDSGRSWASDDRGEGSSNLGSMRRSTGWGGSRVR